MIENLITIILSSAVVSAITSGIITYLLEKRKYNQDFWKIAIEKRLQTYEEIEEILTYFQTTHLVDKNPCHLVFSNVELFNKLQVHLGIISRKRNWISTKLYGKIVELNRLLCGADFIEENFELTDLTEFGIDNYLKIADIRDGMLRIIPRDYLDMPKVESFFKSKIAE
ncbi:hypothetical protein [Zobellia sp. B3R18]|uniref:hypothetical protein n=1 Tax=Zobellia sp. B3R18 TaxID=2841568 RepID=UPI001C065FB8|nr:hypothetical protein [Zobellia sp. B3R18]MBU2975076.1 hypothetical protein [Zobellia sp. B3R18]